MSIVGAPRRSASLSTGSLDADGPNPLAGNSAMLWARGWAALGLLTALSVGCRVPAPGSTGPYRNRPVAEEPPTERPKASQWVSEEDASTLNQGTDPGRVRKNQSSPLGTNLASLSEGVSAAFTNRFRQARRWVSLGRTGKEDGRSLELTEDGWVRQLQRGQSAMAQLRLSRGASYVLAYEGDGAIRLRGADNVRSVGPGQQVFRAKDGRVQVIIERTSFIAPVRNIQVLPGSYAESTQVPLFEPTFLDRLERFSVLRFCDWGGVGVGAPGKWENRTRPDFPFQTGVSGVAYEHMIDLANQLGADVWLCLPFSAEPRYAEGLTTLLQARLRSDLSVIVEYGDEAWSSNLKRPSIRKLNRLADGLDPDPKRARLKYRLQRSAELFAPMYGRLGPARLTRVMSAALGPPSVVETIMSLEGADKVVDAVAVAPRIGSDLGREAASQQGVPSILRRLEGRDLPEAMGAVRRLGQAAQTLGVRLMAYRGGLDLTPGPGLRSEKAKANLRKSAKSRKTASMNLALLEAWKAAGGTTFVVESLFGPGRALATPTTPPAEAPQYQAYLRFAEGSPRWWQRKEPTPLPEVTPSVAPSKPRVEPELALSSSAAPPKMYTAPWVKWVSLGVGLALAGVAAERFVSANDAADDRDRALQELSFAGGVERFDRLQDDVRSAEGDRELAQGMGFAAVGLSSALVGWAIAQWLEEPPPVKRVAPDWAKKKSSGEESP